MIFEGEFPSGCVIGTLQAVLVRKSWTLALYGSRS